MCRLVTVLVFGLGPVRSVKGDRWVGHRKEGKGNRRVLSFVLCSKYSLGQEIPCGRFTLRGEKGEETERSPLTLP